MDLRLAKRYERELLHDIGLNPQDELTQTLVEAYSETLGLDQGHLNRIQRFMEDYNNLVDATFRLRYYQILALYFTEQFFKDVSDHERDERRMLAYWMATGSGKTLVMHINILQYLAWLDDWKIDFDHLQIILTTPGRNLIAQHRRELEPFVELLNERYGGRIELLIETTQALLQYEHDYFDLPEDGLAQRLVLVDEGHIGLSSTGEGEFKKLRARLNAQHSFLFEYSATYHNLGGGVEVEYEDAIIYDYNYARFYNNGYGKDYFFKEIGRDVVVNKDKEAKDNLDECFRVLEDKLQAHDLLHNLPASTYVPDKPLMAFMGNTVEDPKKAGKEGQDDEISDVNKVIQYLATLPSEDRERFRTVFHGDVTGPLVVTRNRDVDDEILLSYGQGEYFGIVNVGNGDSFFNDLNHPNIQKQDDPIRSERYQFQHLDHEDSPINLLIGSRKFAEGWNSFRLSVIGLINLGSSRGNKIIQIFGRGVRLRGANNDGKRITLAHLDDYYSLGVDPPEALRKLETLTIFSLRRSYLETFIKEIQEEVPPRLDFTVKVRPTVRKLNVGGTVNDVKFKTYSKHLPIFKMGKKKVGRKRVILDQGKVEYTYLEDGTEKQGKTLENFRVQLPYQTDRTKEVTDITQDIRDYNNPSLQESWADYLDQAGLSHHLLQEADKAGMLLYVRDADGSLRLPHINDLMALVDDVRYIPKEKLNLQILDRLNLRVASSVISKLKNKINLNINQSNYIFGQKLKQQWENNPGDFIDAYVISKTFPDQATLEAFKAKIEAAETGITDEAGDPVPNPSEELANALSLPPVAEHVYKPLLREVSKDQEDLKIKPDSLNSGEQKFLFDLKTYIDHHFDASDRYQFYLMRNVDTLESIGIYLESDEKAFFPDFILWVIDQEASKTSVIFVDPKGETGIKDANLWEVNEKARIGLRNQENPTLLTLSADLTKEHNHNVEVHSFLLLRDRSATGKGGNVDPELIKRMLAHNILRLDWHDKQEDHSTSQSKLIPTTEMNYLDFIFKQVGISVNAVAESG